jgi:cyclohexadienyl dehydratase
MRNPGKSLPVIAVLASAHIWAAEPRAAPAMPLLDARQLESNVWHVADERLELMPAIAAAKWRLHAVIGDPPREALVIRAAGDRARDVGLVREPVENLMALQIRAARRVQERLVAHWQREGFDYRSPTRGPPLRLAADLRPRLDRLTDELIDALYLMAPFASGIRQAPADPRMSDAERSEFAADLAAIRYALPGSVERARAAGMLRIGTPADYAPFAVAVAGGGAVQGADVQLAAGLAASLGLVPVFVRTSWTTLLDDLEADHFDLVVGGVSATPGRIARALASVPLSRSGKTAIGRCGDQGRLNSLVAIDAPAVTVVENPGGTNEAFARAHLAHARLVIHSDNRTVFEEILAGRSDVMFTDETEIRLATHRHPQLCRLLADAYDPADKVFLMARAGHWAEAVNPWLGAALAAGTPAQLLEQNLE